MVTCTFGGVALYQKSHFGSIYVRVRRKRLWIDYQLLNILPSRSCKWHYITVCDSVHDFVHYWNWSLIWNALFSCVRFLVIFLTAPCYNYWTIIVSVVALCACLLFFVYIIYLEKETAYVHTHTTTVTGWSQFVCVWMVRSSVWVHLLLKHVPVGGLLSLCNPVQCVSVRNSSARSLQVFFINPCQKLTEECKDECIFLVLSFAFCKTFFFSWFFFFAFKSRAQDDVQQSHLHAHIIIHNGHVIHSFVDWK